MPDRLWRPSRQAGSTGLADHGPQEGLRHRAFIARAGLWGNHGYDANYDLIGTHADGDVPAGTFRPILRTYEPSPAILDGTDPMPDFQPKG